MLSLILGLLGLGGGLGALAYFLGPSALIGFARSALGILAKIPWQAWLTLAIAAIIGFLAISRSHWIERARADESRAELVCKAVREVAGRPRQACELNEIQIQAFGKSIRDLEGALAEQNARIEALGRQNANLQAQAAEAKRQAARSAGEAESVSARLDASSRQAPARPCPVSKALEEQWQ